MWDHQEKEEKREVREAKYMCNLWNMNHKYFIDYYIILWFFQKWRKNSPNEMEKQMDEKGELFFP